MSHDWSQPIRSEQLSEIDSPLQYTGGPQYVGVGPNSPELKNDAGQHTREFLLKMLAKWLNNLLFCHFY